MTKKFFVGFISVLVSVILVPNIMAAQSDVAPKPTLLQIKLWSLENRTFGRCLICLNAEIVDTITSRGECEAFVQEVLSGDSYTAWQEDKSSYNVQIVTFDELDKLHLPKHHSRREDILNLLTNLPDSVVIGMKAIKCDWQYKHKRFLSFGFGTDDTSLFADMVATYIVWPKHPYKPFPWWYIAMGVTIAAVGIIWLIARLFNRKNSALYKKLQEVNMANVDMNLDKFRTQIYTSEYYAKIQRILELYKKACYYEEHFDAIDMAQLQQDINQHLNNYLVRLKWLYPNLTAIDIDMCSLYILGLSRTDISIVMERDRSTIYRREKMLLRDVFPNAQTLNTALDELRNKK